MQVRQHNSFSFQYFQGAVVTNVFESDLAKFLNQQPDNYFVRKLGGSAVFLAAVTGAMYLGPYGLMATIVLIPVVKQVAKRVAIISGNVFSHAVAVIVSREEADRSFSERIRASMTTESNPLVVSCFGAIVGEVVWTSFITFPTPTVVRGVAKDVLKALVAYPFKQVGKAAAQYGFNQIFNISSKKPFDCVSIEEAFVDMACDCGGTTAIDLTCARYACSFFNRFVFYSVGLEIGRISAGKIWKLGDSALYFNQS